MIGTFLTGNLSNFRHLHLESVTSTNTYLNEIAKDGDPGNLWVTADSQTSGKGSRGRDWASFDGNLLASLLLVEPAPAIHLGELTFVAAISAARAISQISDGRLQPQLKWPNDILLNGSKCGGILLESSEAHKRRFVVIGLGVNCRNHPDEALHKATSLKAEGFDVSPALFFEVLAEAFSHFLDVWQSGVGFEQIRSIWLEQVYGLGQEITVIIPNKEKLTGIFASIDDKGYMLLQLPDGSHQRISTADIFFNNDARQGN